MVKFTQKCVKNGCSLPCNLDSGTIAQALLMNLQDIGGRLVKDVAATKWFILAGLGAAVVTSFLYILMMRWFADILVWLSTYAVLSLNG